MGFTPSQIPSWLKRKLSSERASSSLFGTSLHSKLPPSGLYQRMRWSSAIATTQLLG